MNPEVGTQTDGMEQHKAARPMRVLKDDEGNTWLCDADADPSGDFEKQGCWRCQDLPFTRND